MNILLILSLKKIPKKFYPYKILSISSIDYKNIKAILIGFAHYKYQDENSNLNIFKFLDENFFSFYICYK